MKRLEELKDKKMKIEQEKTEEMKNEWGLFCQTLNMDHWDKAQEMWSFLQKEGNNPDLLKVNTKQYYEKGFNFPEVAKNDDSVEVLQPLDLAQDNLNSNPNNKILINNFIVAAQKAASELQDKYHEFWTDPAIAI